MTGSVRFALLGMLIALPACRDVTAPKNVSDAEALWRSKNISSYVFTGSKACFCLDASPVMVTVIDDKVVRVADLETGAIRANDSWYTIDQFFDRLASGTWHPRTLAFDETLGYPTTIEICCIEDDSGVIYKVSNLGQVAFVE